MPKTNLETIVWRERAFVTINEAASIIARTPDWVRTALLKGRLEGRRITKSSPTVVTVESLQRLIEQSVPATISQSAVRNPHVQILRCVVNNDK